VTKAQLDVTKLRHKTLTLDSRLIDFSELAYNNMCFPTTQTEQSRDM